MILAITSSGRERSNSSILLETALRALPPSIRVVRRDLARTDFRGCTGCGSCRSGAPGCVLNDGLTPILAEVAEARGVILSAPVYYGNVSGICKSFLDRWYGFRDGERKLRMQAGRPLLYVIAQGHPNPEAYLAMAESLDKIFSAYGFKPERFIASGIEGQGEALAHPGLLEAASGHGIRFSEKLKGKDP